ncbi:MAG: hypothetical protein APF84_05940 [Gracilibacter sp. BRH_c7a]|nr:MAG: hypothetical protein APF84_05940 [Gracilibacter sp. BRH_c7a]
MERYYLALGDSITTGYGVGDRGFAFRYYAYLRSLYHNFRFINRGVDGLTASGLTHMLLANNQLRELIARAEIITITIGSNDLMKYAVSTLHGANSNVYQMLANMEKNIDLIGQEIRRLNLKATVKVGTIYCPDLGGQYYQSSREAQKIISKANKVIIYSSVRHRFQIVSIDKVFYSREQLFIGKDHIHPNILGHQAIAEEFIRS